MGADGARQPLVLPLIKQTYEIWSLESGWFLFYGFFMVVLSYAMGQLPLVGFPLSLALEGPLAGGLILATRRILLRERPELEDFLGGFRQALPLAALSVISACLSLLGLFLLILPGLLIAALLALALPVLLLEGRDMQASLRTSFRLVRPRLWGVAALMLMLALVQVLLTLPLIQSLIDQTEPTLMQVLPLFLGLGLLGPFHGILTALLYLRLKEESSTTLIEV